MSFLIPPKLTGRLPIETGLQCGYNVRDWS